MHDADLGFGYHAALLAFSCVPELANHAGLWVGMLEIILQIRAARLDQLWESCVLHRLDFLLKAVCRVADVCIVPIHCFNLTCLAACSEMIEPLVEQTSHPIELAIPFQ